MALVLGIDTSNYTTSAALYDTESNCIFQAKKLLPVKSGQCGLRQSDAVFHHTRQLPEIIGSLDFKGKSIDAVAVSTAPRQCEGSYMPCFLAGVSVAKSLSTVNSIPMYSFSHQQGHIAAAAFGANREDLLNVPFIAFHVSGGTTEALLVTPEKDAFIDVKLVAKTNDLNAGQLIDRVGVMLGLDFPCGIELEKLASACNVKIKVKPSVRETDCSLSGFENKIARIYAETQDKCYASAYTLKAVSSTIIAMTKALQDKYGVLPLLYAGGVMSDEIIKNDILNNFSASFAPPVFSADNAAGIAYLGGRMFLDESRESL